MYKCNIEDCSAEFNKKWKIEEHIAKHTGQRPFVCGHNGCNKSYTRKPHLQRHQQTHTGRKDFVCQEEGCGQAFTLRDNLKKHIKRTHQQAKVFEFKCDQEGCGRCFTKKQTLKIHQYEHTNIKPYKCEHECCGARFLVPSKLKRHAKQHEGYTCTEDGCDEVFSKWSLLRRHISDDHVTEYKCSECNKVFYKKFKLRVHMSYHSDARKVFMCPKEECQFLALRLYELGLHIQNYHEGARPFKCSHDGCSKTFVYKHSMVHHQVVHTHGYVRPRPKPKKKRGPASKISGFPDEATRGPRQPKKPPENHKQGQPSQGASSISMEVTDADATVSEQSLEEHPVVGPTELRNVLVAAEVEVPFGTEDGDAIHGKTAAVGTDRVAEEQGVVLTTDHQSLALNNQSLPRGLQTTGAEDLDSLIQAVTKSRSNTTKEMVDRGPMLKHDVLVN